ncbi:uncharacterized protein BCR38DRAFT_454853 [Pseudomassariella vexata]|uniref:RRM domain-containing protein n=1 Tax=Pseudomassariella vexata TaxID=1141098 RepID=A0A1Y2EF34_9PEZI|nr:uncharacterized protein BCR38DRAFT_454853 [Pseudomassariella vexata]ORY69924.1 hypothetical protein BCR38DRAFT_454853 [Pseudomassariella vexata]
MVKQHATDFEKIINAGRERKKNEELAARIFSRDKRRQSAPIKAGNGPSLASRVGVNKRVSSVARVPAGNVNGEWTHDLHNSRSTPDLRAQPKLTSLAARIHAPGTKPPTAANRNANTKRVAKFANAFNSPAAASQLNVHSAPPANGLTIRGLAGPFVVMAQNFAPGTTAADIESAMTPVGGLARSCRLVKTHPLVIAEIVFENKEGADRVIETFNNQTADGRLLHVYLKPGGGYTPMPPTGPRAQRSTESRVGSNSVVVDGSMGFDEPMETADAGYGESTNGGLYSDRLVPTGPANGGSGNRRGRGFHRGR